MRGALCQSQREESYAETGCDDGNVDRRKICSLKYEPHMASLWKLQSLPFQAAAVAIVDAVAVYALPLRYPGGREDRRRSTAVRR